MDRRTVEIYEARADEWRARRSPGGADRVRAFAALLRPVGPVADLGCGPGWHTAALGAPAVALDAAAAMLRQVRERDPTAWPVQADLEALPFRSGALAGAWASASYVHLPRTRVPVALADLHRSLTVGAPVELLLFGGDQEHGPRPDDDFPGRRFSSWPAELLAAVIEGAGFLPFQLDVVRGEGADRLVVRATRARTLADTVGPGMRLLVCGLNPSHYAADRGVGYARPGNRFWPAALAAGLVSVDRDPSHALRHHGVGMTDLVKRATVAAAELGAAEHRRGLDRLERLSAWLRPGAVCFVGLAGWRAAVDRRARAGLQDRLVGGRPAYVMPSTSGLNARTGLDDHVGHLRAAAAIADGG